MLQLAVIQCCIYKLVLALVAVAQNTLQAVLEEYQMPLDAGAPLEQAVQETGPPGLFQAQVVPVQETQPAFQLQDALLQAVGGLGNAQESLHQRNLPSAMVAGQASLNLI